MRSLMLVAMLFTSFNPPASDTWSGTASNQIPTGNALRDSPYNDVTIPPGLNKKGMTKQNVIDYTWINPYNIPSSSRLLTKQEIESYL